MGIAQSELAGPLSRGDETVQLGAAERIEKLAEPNLPNLAALARASRRTRPESDFRRGLEIILRGLDPQRS